METQQADNALTFTPAQKSVQLTGPRSRRAQEVSLSFATPQSNSSKAVGLHHQHVCYISNAEHLDI